MDRLDSEEKEVEMRHLIRLAVDKVTRFVDWLLIDEIEEG